MRAKASGARLTLVLLGGFDARVLHSGRPVALALKKARGVLACLALAPGGARPRQALTGLLWSDVGEAEARNNFRVTLSSLRTALTVADLRCLRVEREMVALDLDAVDVDTVSFRRLVADGSTDALAEAVRLYRGELLEGLDIDEAAFEEWLVGEREQLRMLAIGACQKVLAHHLRTDADDPALATALRLLALDPLQEPVHRTVMRLHMKHARLGSALRQYEACAMVLQRDLGVAPARETRHLYEEIRRSGTAAGSRADDRPHTLAWPLTQRVPQVGRLDQMEQLHVALGRSRGGHGQCVAVLGEAGIGKTRLVSELAAEALPGGNQVWLGRAYESDRTLTFGPWVDAIRTSGLEDGARFGSFSPIWRAELGRLVPELGEPPHERTRHQDGVRRLFEAVVQLVKHVIERQPLVLILEDFHWADELSVRLLSFLARRITEWPILIVVTAREEEVDARSALLRALDELGPVQISMGPLTRAETVKLVQELARTDRRTVQSESTVAQIWALSRGNPFMIVEAVHALSDGATVSPEGALSLTPRALEVVAGRLGRLSDRGRRLVAVAAVIGRVFEFPVLQRASGLGELEAAEGVDDLIRRRLVHVIPQGLEVTHDWIREVAYGQLQPPLRSVLHAAVARALEDNYAANLEPHYPALARHFREGEVWGKAAVYLHAAGRAAAARVGHREAVSRFESALEALGHMPESRDTLERGIDLRLDLRYSLSGLGEFRLLITHLREAEPLARKLEDEGRLGWVRVYMSYYVRMTGRPADAYPLAESVRAIAEKLGDVDLEIEADYELGMAHLFAGDHANAQEILRRAFLTRGKRLERPRGRAVTVLSVRSYLASSLAECGHFEEAAIHGREALRLAQELDSPINIVLAHSQLANVHEIKGDFDGAIPILERGLALGRERELTLLTPGVLGSLANVYAMSGRVADGLVMLDETLKVFDPAAVRASQSHVIVKLAEICLVAGRLEQATVLAARALAMTREHGQRGWEARALRLLAEIATHHGPLHIQEAEEHYRAALTRSHELGLRPLEARCQLGLGRLYQRGSWKAQEHLARATTMLRQLDMQYWLAQAVEAAS